MAIVTIRRGTRQTALPVVSMTSDAFRAGYAQASSDEYTGWHTEYAPREQTVVDFLCNAVAMISSDMASGHDCDYEMRWVAGLLTGWLRRTDF